MRRSQRATVAVAAAGALALTGLIAPAAFAAEAPTELFFSEVVEGTSNSKAVEIYNPTGASVTLEGYSLRYFFNGSPSAGLTIPLAGSVAAGDVHVVAQATADPAILAVADQTNGSGWFNGDDAVALVKGDTTVDVFGQIGFDPGTEWGTGLASTVDNTLRRKADLCVGDLNGGDAFDPAVQWDGYATNTFDGLGAHTANCGDVEPPVTKVVINEFSASTAEDDVEYVELLSTPTSDLSAYRVLEIEGDAPSSGVAPFGLVDEVISFPAPGATGRSLASLANGALENGTMTLLLVSGTIPAAGSDIDANDDGVIDDGLGFTVVDAVAVSDGNAADRTYSSVVLSPGFGGQTFSVGGASRIPDGTDTDTAADWVRNDYDRAGIPGFPGTLAAGEAVNTPGAANSVTPAGPPPAEAGCDLPVVTIGSVQGSGTATPVSGSTVRIEGTVVGDFQTGGFQGYYVQDGGDGDLGTSDAIFVYAPAGAAVASGDVVNVAGVVTEAFGMTQLAVGDMKVCATGTALPTPVPLTLPVSATQREAVEGMYVTLPQTLAILEYFDYARYGTIDVGLGRQSTPTARYLPTDPAAAALAAANMAERITIDDGRSSQNPDPALHPNGEAFTLENTFRGGDLVTDVTGILDWRFDTWAIQPTQGAEFQVANPRPEVPEVGGDLLVSSFNVLNYFTTLDDPNTAADDDIARGANTVAEFDRQEAKIVAALAAIDADVFGLIEIENNTDSQALATLTAALNEHLGADVYDYVKTGKIGTDVITTALMYKPSAVTPVGDFALMNQAKDPRWLDTRNRPGLTQTFEDADGATFTVVVNHLKSKGSACAGEPAHPLQGECNTVRTNAANALADWLATDPTGQGTLGRELIIGDLNAYDKEDPIVALKNKGYTDLILEYQGEDAYSYVFDGQQGYLDHALAGPGLVADVRGASPWNINADEPSLIDYDMSFKQPAQDALFAPDPYRSSDHDPVLVGLDLTPPDTTPPTIEAVAIPSFILVPNNKARTVQVHVEAEDDRGEVTVELTDVTTNGKPGAAYTEVDDRTFSVKAVNGAIYTFTYTATDAAGNTATDTATVIVGVKGLIEYL
ncbi:ExeM/NucH family extracellular endonuclease [Microbacterium sp. CFBP9034]|uniref:ExeM/NucH family extracellular endonuclease n=1 Tax=Microbacterium sp. CFBP9034 TaxID=3096540 RepID=UPI002A6AE4B8|nr:ExeM/NucH family extracellular endonuclease [Microbacterium sp. CFBP9034]MDY0908146.1 ExeM/NucH family extracellular endonuclease [Microbacterium sp. CFBP9034]